MTELPKYKGPLFDVCVRFLEVITALKFTKSKYPKMHATRTLLTKP
jgi:hypothetical protein